MLTTVLQQAAADPEAGTAWAKAFVDAWPAIIAFIGIVVSLIVNQVVSGRRWKSERLERQDAWDQEREQRRLAREHDHELDRNRILRADRLELYKVLVDAAGDVLTRTSDALSLPSDQDRYQLAMNSNAAWASVLGQSRLLAADAVYDAGVRIENRRKDWLMERNRAALDPFWRTLVEAPSTTPAPPPEASDESSRDAWWMRATEGLEKQNVRTTESEDLVAALADACKADIKELKA